MPMPSRCQFNRTMYFRAPNTLAEGIAKLAKARGMTPSAVIRDAVRKAVRDTPRPPVADREAKA